MSTRQNLVLMALPQAFRGCLTRHDARHGSGAPEPVTRLGHTARDGRDRCPARAIDMAVELGDGEAKGGGGREGNGLAMTSHHKPGLPLWFHRWRWRFTKSGSEQRHPGLR